MNYVIFGLNRVTKDFLYIFDDLHIDYIICDSNESIQNFNQFDDIDILSLDEAPLEKRLSKIIICGFDHYEKKKRLEDKGLVYREDFVFEDDLFEKLDSFTIPSNRIIAVWGLGTVFNNFIDELRKNVKIDCYVDSNKEGFINDIEVVSPDRINNLSDYFFIITVDKDGEIRNYLSDNGLKEYEDFINYQKIISAPSNMLRKTIFDTSFYDLECNTMLNHLEIFYNGNTRCCCTTFVSENLENVLDRNKDELWHSLIHKIMCLSTENRTYTFCKKDMCPLFVSKKREDCQGKPFNNTYKKMCDNPKVIAIGHDGSCNLKCITCRKELYFAKEKELARINLITEKIKKDYLNDCEFLILAGDGEVFASKAYRRIYEDNMCNPDYIRILTNGTLFTPENWRKFSKDKKGKIMLTVSVDAATKETYEKIRCNGNFDNLRANMEFASGLREKGELQYFRMNFVVQRSNFLEMVPFVKWGERLKCDEVFFTKILNWGTYTEDEFEKISMMEKDGITPKPELAKILDSKEFRNSKICDLGTIRYSHKMDNVGVVDNYYKWELEKRGGRLFE